MTGTANAQAPLRLGIDWGWSLGLPQGKPRDNLFYVPLPEKGRGPKGKRAGNPGVC